MPVEFFEGRASRRQDGLIAITLKARASDRDGNGDAVVMAVCLPDCAEALARELVAAVKG